MKRYYAPKKAELTWIVTSGARYLCPSINPALAAIRPEPRPVAARPRQRPYTRTRQSLTPLSRRLAFVGR
jgi:hypothetical protein